MQRDAALSVLQNEPELVPCLETSIAQARELERKLLEGDVPVMLAKPPPKACCAGGCGCGGKVQLLVREADLAAVSRLMNQEWLDAVAREGTLPPERLVQLGLPNAEACPACGFTGPLKAGACGDCGLQLD